MSHSSKAPFTGIDHVQLAAPPGCEAEARRFFGDLLGLREIPKPAALAVRGGLWFECGDQQIHVGVERDFRPAKKAHPALRLSGEAASDALKARLQAAGVTTKDDDEIEGATRFFAEDPWGNRLEFVASRAPKTHAVSTRAISVEGADLYVEERGRGEPLLLLHGLTGTGGDFRHLFDLDALATTYRVIVPDARGHGRSTDGSREFRFGRLARDVITILDELGIDQVRAIGLSLGAKTLLHVATSAPNRVAAMVLVSATPRFPSETRALFRDAAFHEHSAEEWARMRALHVHGDDQIERLWKLPGRLAVPDIDMDFTPTQLRTINSPTLIVTGDRDPFYPVELAVELYRNIARSSLWVVPSALHTPVFLAERDAFVRAATSFLREHGSAPLATPRMG